MPYLQPNKYSVEANTSNYKLLPPVTSSYKVSSGQEYSCPAISFVIEMQIESKIF